MRQFKNTLNNRDRPSIYLAEDQVSFWLVFSKVKICWDNIEDLYISFRGNFRKGNTTYVYVEKCGVCEQPFLTEKSRPSKFCSHKCVYKSTYFRRALSNANKGPNNNMFNKKHSDVVRKKISLNRRGKLLGKDNHNFGGNFSNSHKEHISKAKVGTKLSLKTRQKMSEIRKGTRIGIENPMWKGGVSYEPYCEQWLDNEQP